MLFNFSEKTSGSKINRCIASCGLVCVVIIFSALTAAAQKGIAKFDYEYKSNAQGKLNAERNRGNDARMYYDSSRRRWIVEVNYGGASSNGGETFDDSDDESGDSSSSTRKIVYHYEYKSNAQGKVKAEQRRGKRARMFYNQSMRRWTVEVEESANASSRRGDGDDTPTVTTTKRKINTSANVGSGSLPNGASVSYFPDKQMAEEIHRAAIRQGDWTKMWYDENRRAWAVAIKVR